MGTRSIGSASASLSMSASVRNTMTNDTAKSATGTVSFSRDFSFSSGVSAEEIDRAWQYKGTLSSGGTVTLDLYGYVGLDLGAGEGNDIVGQAMSPIPEIVAIALSNENAVGAAGRLECEGGASNPFEGFGDHTVALANSLGGQGLLFMASPDETAFALTTSARNLKLNASGGSVAYRVILFGRHDSDDSSSSSLSSSSQSSSSSSSSSLSSSSQSSSSPSSQSSSSSSSSNSSSSSSTS